MRTAPAVVLLALALTGCISEDRERTLAQCQLQYPSMRMIFCMRSQGYALDDANETCALYEKKVVVNDEIITIDEMNALQRAAELQAQKKLSIEEINELIDITRADAARTLKTVLAEKQTESASHPVRRAECYRPTGAIAKIVYKIIG